MDIDEAKSVMQNLKAYRKRHEENAITLQRAAALAKEGKLVDARRLKNSIDKSPVVFGGDTLAAMEAMNNRVEELEQVIDKTLSTRDYGDLSAELDMALYRLRKVRAGIAI
jgi:hypothetical protein